MMEPRIVANDEGEHRSLTIRARKGALESAHRLLGVPDGFEPAGRPLPVIVAPNATPLADLVNDGWARDDDGGTELRAMLVAAALLELFPQQVARLERKDAEGLTLRVFTAADGIGMERSAVGGGDDEITMFHAADLGDRIIERSALPVLAVSTPGTISMPAELLPAIAQCVDQGKSDDAVNLLVAEAGAETATASGFVQALVTQTSSSTLQVMRADHGKPRHMTEVRWIDGGDAGLWWVRPVLSDSGVPLIAVGSISGERLRSQLSDLVNRTRATSNGSS